MNPLKDTYDDPALGGDAIARNRARELLGRVMGYVAVTVGFAALGAYLDRNLSGMIGLVLLFAALAIVFGLHFAVAKGREQLAIGRAGSHWRKATNERTDPRWDGQGGRRFLPSR